MRGGMGWHVSRLRWDACTQEHRMQGKGCRMATTSPGHMTITRNGELWWKCQRIRSSRATPEEKQGQQHIQRTGEAAPTERRLCIARNMEVKGTVVKMICWGMLVEQLIHHSKGQHEKRRGRGQEVRQEGSIGFIYMLKQGCNWLFRE